LDESWINVFHLTDLFDQKAESRLDAVLIELAAANRLWDREFSNLTKNAAGKRCCRVGLVTCVKAFEQRLVFYPDRKMAGKPAGAFEDANPLRRIAAAFQFTTWPVESSMKKA
jgi:hypothetical protein